MGVLGFGGGLIIFIQRPLDRIIVDIGAYLVNGLFIADHMVVIITLP